MTERTYTRASWLSRHSGLSWNSGVLMKTSEGISFSIAHLSRLKQLRCKPGQKLPWFVDEKPPKRTNLPILVAPHWKHGLRKTRCSCDHVSFLLDPDWFWEDPGDFVTPWSDKDSLWNHLTSFSHVFSHQIFKSFFLINRYFSFLRYSYVLSIWKLTCLSCCLREFDWKDIHWSRVCDWRCILSEVLIVISIRQKLLVSQIMHANAQPFNYIKSVLAKQKF